MVLRRYVAAGLLALAVIAAGVGATAQVFNAPKGRAENVRFEQSAGVITIFFDLLSDDPRAIYRVGLEVSSDAGLTFNVRPRTVSGDIGTGIRPGPGKKIIWEASRDVERVLVDQIKFRVLAEAGVAAPTSGLRIQSDPPGATVLVDDQARGVTPLTVSDLAAGTHRVRVMHEGYLENARSVTVREGASETVDVKLTPAAPAKGGGGSKLKYIVPIAGGAAAAAVFAGKGKGTVDSGPTNQPPSTGVVTVSNITLANPSDGTTGLQAATLFRFTATASDSIGRPVTLTWDFNDGSPAATGGDVSHVYNAANTYVVKVTGTAGTNTDTKQLTIVSRAMTGRWNGSISSPALSFTMELIQAASGTGITGTYTDRNGTGTVTSPGLSDPRNVSLRITQGSRTIELACKGDGTMTACPGTVSGAYTSAMTMSRQ